MKKSHRLRNKNKENNKNINKKQSMKNNSN